MICQKNNGGRINEKNNLLIDFNVLYLVLSLAACTGQNNAVDSNVEDIELEGDTEKGQNTVEEDRT